MILFLLGCVTSYQHYSTSTITALAGSGSTFYVLVNRHDYAEGVDSAGRSVDNGTLDRGGDQVVLRCVASDDGPARCAPVLTGKQALDAAMP